MLRQLTALAALLGLTCLAANRADAQVLSPRAFASLGTLDTAPGAYVVDTDALTLTGPNGFLVHGVRWGNMAVFAFDTIRLNADSTLTGRGASAVALLSASNATIAGTIDVSGGNGDAQTQGVGGPGGYSQGPGAGAIHVGGGGGFGGRGYPSDGSSAGASYGDLWLKLEGGSGGGRRFNGLGSLISAGGGGGGAVQIGAAGALSLTGTIRSDGGRQGVIGYSPGGGAGGGVLLQGETVTLAATGSVLASGSYRAGGGRVLIATRQEGGFANAGGTLSVAGGQGGGGAGVVTIMRRPPAPRFDLLGEGRDTVLWQNAATGDVTWWRTDGSSWTGEWGYVSQDRTRGWKLVATADLDGDKNPDLLWRNGDTGDVTYWRMEGAQWTGEWGVLARGVPLKWVLAGAADVTGDGQIDLVWQEAQRSDVAYWPRQGGAWLQEFRPLPQTVPAGWRLVGLPDLDGDWRADLLWRDTATGDLHAWKMFGTEKLAEARIGAGVPADWQIVGLR